MATRIDGEAIAEYVGATVRSEPGEVTEWGGFRRCEDPECGGGGASAEGDYGG